MQVLTKKILNLKLWPVNSRIENGRLVQETADGKPWSMNVTELDGEVLCGKSQAHEVSQFTLYAKTAKGTKPDFHRAMGSEASRDFYNAFLNRLRDTFQPDKIKGESEGSYRRPIRRNDGCFIDQ